MLSLRRCRELLPRDATLSDAELEELRGLLYVLAEVLIHEFTLQQGTPEPGSRLDAMLDLMPPEDREAIEERAAIKEYEAGLERDEAERAALTAHLGRKLI